MSDGEGVNQTRQAILDATFQVLAEGGLRGATTRGIAQAAGVNEVTIFRHFGSKNNLITCALNTRFAAVRREAVQYTGDIEADLIRLASNVGAALEAFGPVVRTLFAELPLDPELASGVVGPRELFSAITAMLNRYQQAGLLVNEPGGSLVPAFIGPLFVRFLVMGHPVAPVELGAPFDAERHVKRFLYGRLAVPADSGDKEP
ncbi:MAG: TetR/AcrR family transcriptional regulator [Propionibacteriaceae bacterium]|jgi:AcrR family transcriptional regulator|nr:TetR/AcrR family transcriptional regulator [Propionibacteriaceae bacterium]